jgi:hypothetical protein
MASLVRHALNALVLLPTHSGSLVHALPVASISSRGSTRDVLAAYWHSPCVFC